MTDALTNEQEGRVRLPPIQNGVRECWLTVLHDSYLNIDTLIGAGTKEACMKAFAVYSDGLRCDESLVYRVLISKTTEEALPALEQISK